ncbi:hypothetical protein [Duganella vulcania]|uniref:Uncharacterized protein n=1 Tax=Duganella vulcania TaxID=2692166 RepID=A0A845GGV2_9BURK|nr:hypothetical protein [Duganella vulcania]MYM92652.1 hypothetical protein [Duganella vulcania]
MLYVEKDRWGRVDRTFVWFDDQDLNDRPYQWAGTIHPDDRKYGSDSGKVFVPGTALTAASTSSRGIGAGLTFTWVFLFSIPFRYPMTSTVLLLYD